MERGGGFISVTSHGCFFWLKRGKFNRRKKIQIAEGVSL
nr:MAG TPA: hypothetical protein [Caudoviricetes sp.]